MTSGHFRIRDATPTEFDVVGELTAEAYLAGGALADANEDGYLSHLRDAASRAQQAQVLVALADNAQADLVGTVTVSRFGTPWAEIARQGEAELRMLAVRPSWWGRGVADAIVVDVIQRLRVEGVERVVLLVLDGNPAPVRLYERHGFRPTPERNWSPYEGLLLRAFQLDL